MMTQVNGLVNVAISYRPLKNEYPKNCADKAQEYIDNLEEKYGLGEDKGKTLIDRLEYFLSKIEREIRISKGWQSIDTIPIGEIIEIESPPHLPGIARSARDKDNNVVWKWLDRKEGIIPPIYPIRWRSIS